MLIDLLFALLFHHIFFWFGWNSGRFNWFTNRNMWSHFLFVLQRSSSLRRAPLLLLLLSPPQLPRPAGVPPELRQRLQQLQGDPQLVCGHAGEWAHGRRGPPSSSMLGGVLLSSPERKCQRSLTHVCVHPICMYGGAFRDVCEVGFPARRL